MNAEEIRATINKNIQREKDAVERAISNSITTNISNFERDLKNLLSGTTFQTPPRRLVWFGTIENGIHLEYTKEIANRIALAITYHFQSRGIKFKTTPRHDMDAAGRRDCGCEPDSIGCIKYYSLDVCGD